MAGQVVGVWCGWLCAVWYAVLEVSVWFCLSDIDQGQTCQVGQVAGECTDVYIARMSGQLWTAYRGSLVTWS